MVSSISGNNNVWTNMPVAESGAASAPVATKTQPAGQQVVAADRFEAKVAGNGSNGQAGVTLPQHNSAVRYDAATTKENNFDVILTDASSLQETVAAVSVAAAKVAKNDTAAYNTALTALKNSTVFKNASKDVQEAVLSQCKNFPNARSVNTLQRMMSAKWFNKMSLPDQQRAAKSLAYLSEVSNDSNNSQQKALIDNTLNRVLSDKIPLHFDDMDDDPGTITFGYAPAFGSGIYINRDLIPDGNGAFPKTNSNARHAAIATIVHETSHQVNGDVNQADYKYFQAEYRAWYVGFIAENGREPTQREAFNRCTTIFSLYSNIADALYKDSFISNALDWLNNKVTGDDYESTKILKFMNKFIGAKGFDFENASKDDIRTFLLKVLPNPSAKAPVPDTSLKPDMDN